MGIIYFPLGFLPRPTCTPLKGVRQVRQCGSPRAVPCRAPPCEVRHRFRARSGCTRSSAIIFGRNEPAMIHYHRSLRAALALAQCPALRDTTTCSNEPARVTCDGQSCAIPPAQVCPSDGWRTRAAEPFPVRSLTAPLSPTMLQCTRIFCGAIWGTPDARFPRGSCASAGI